MLILLANDDGIEAPGILALERRFKDAGHEVVVVAPDKERSGFSHSVTLTKPLYLEDRGPDRHAISGTPVDAVNLGVNHLLKPRKPDLVLSGINRGANLGCDIHYSGTVGAAREGCLLDLPAMAVSLATIKERPDFEAAADFALLLSGLFVNTVMPPRTFLNVNVPDLPREKIKGVKVTTQGIRIYNNAVREAQDREGVPNYTIGGIPEGGVKIMGSDIVAVEDGYVSVTPLRLDVTNDCALDWLETRLGGGNGGG